MNEISDLLLPLMVGSITAAGLTLTGGNFFKEYVKEHAEYKLKAPLNNLVPIAPLLLRVKRQFIAVALVFLFSEVLLVGYIAFNCADMVYASYLFFFAAILILLYSIIFALIRAWQQVLASLHLCCSLLARISPLKYISACLSTSAQALLRRTPI